MTIPYFAWHSFQLGPLTIYTWGLFVALGFLVGGWLAARMAKQRGQDPRVVWDLLGWLVIGGLIGGRLFHVLFYDPATYLGDPLRIFAIWSGGLSSIGGFIGATLAGVLVLRRRHLDVWAWADTMIFGLPLGYTIGRIGCFMIHDHPGTATDFFLGVRYPDGVVRHDLGFYGMLDGMVLALVFLLMAKRKAPRGAYLVMFLIWYGFTRFFLDFLRASDGAIADARYLGLTPAQFASIAMVGFGVWIWLKRFLLSLRGGTK